MREQKVKIIELEEYQCELESVRKIEATLALKQRIIDRSKSRSSSDPREKF